MTKDKAHKKREGLTTPRRSKRVAMMGTQVSDSGLQSMEMESQLQILRAQMEAQMESQRAHMESQLQLMRSEFQTMVTMMQGIIEQLKSSKSTVSHAPQDDEEKPTRKEIIDALAHILEKVDLSTPSSHAFFDSILKDLGKHFNMDLSDRRDVRLMITMATCKGTMINGKSVRIY